MANHSSSKLIGSTGGPRADRRARRSLSAATAARARHATAGPAGALPGGLLVRRCACGGGCPRCAAEPRVQGPAEGLPSTGVGLSAGVKEVLRSSGQPLDPTTRAFMEPRFAHDFRQVRVHTDAQAAVSARAMNASAYAVGGHVVFDAGRYAPGTDEGRQLLAHELAHVALTGHVVPGAGPLRVSEPGEPAEREAERLAVAAMRGERNPDTPLRVSEAVPAAVFRKVAAANVGCTGGRNQAPADPVAHLTRVEGHAQGLAQATAILVTAQVAASIIGVTGPPSAVRLAYEARFGLPPRVRGGFRARLTGTVFPNREDAVNDEMDGLSDRLQAIADKLDQSIHYKCITGPTTFMDCEGHCRGRSATACAGIRAILLCPSFWGLSENGQATLLIHETAHMRWANVLHAANFRHASCYANFVADIFNLPLTTPACPAPATP